MRILLVEDDEPLAKGLQQSLRNEGYAINWVGNGKLALSAVSAAECELLVLDLGLPDMDGISVLRQAKKLKPQLPVLILTARDSLDSKVEGLDLGADDYLSKPFDMEELFARLRVIERRLGTNISSVISLGNVSLDTKASIVSLSGTPIVFSRREYMIIKTLMENIGRIQSKSQLETRLYEWGDEIASNAIEVHIHNIRKKLPNKFIKTIRGVGYMVSRTE